MDWIKEAEDKLRHLDSWEKSLPRTREEIRQLEEDAHQLRGAMKDGTPVQGGGSGREDWLYNNIAKRDELNRLLQATEHKIGQVREVLEGLSREDRRLLELMVIRYKSGNLNRACSELHMAPASVYRRRRQAIREFAIHFYGCAET